MAKDREPRLRVNLEGGDTKHVWQKKQESKKSRKRYFS